MTQHVTQADLSPALGDAPFRLLADRLPALCFMADVTGKVTWCNRRWYDYTGAPLDAEPEQIWPTLHHPDLRKAVARRWRGALESEQTEEMVVPLLGADGQYRPFLARAEPVRDGDDRVVCWLGTMTELPAQQEIEHNQRFLLDLGDALHDEVDPTVILHVIGERLAAHLNVGRVGYGEVSADGRQVTAASRGWVAQSMPGSPGTYRLDDFGIGAAETVRRGEALIVTDVMSDPNVAKDVHLAFGIRAAVTIPLVKRGALAALLYVHSPVGRVWRDAEVQLIRDVAERTWAILERARAEAARRESEERLRLALEGGMLGTIQWDLTVMRGRWSRQACAIFGVEPGEEVSLEDFSRVIHPDDRARVLRQLQEALRDGTQYAAEYRVVHPDGGVRWVVSRARVERDAGGLAVRTAGVVADITDRKLAEERLRESELRTRAIVEATPECVKIVSADGALVYINSAGLRMIGADGAAEAGMTGLDVVSVVAPEHRARWRERHLRVCAGESLVWEFDVVGLKGERRRVETHAVPLRALSGEVQQLAVTRDVTERKAAEEQLRASEERFRGLFETAHEGVWLVDRHGRTLFINQRMAGLLGYDAEEMIGEAAPKFCFPEDVPAAQARIASNLAGRPEQFEFRFRRRDGTALPVLAASSPLWDGAGHVVGAVGMFNDLTERKQAEAELQRSREALYQSEKLTALGSLLAGVSHELNNPLSVVLSLSQLLEGKAQGTPYGERAAKIRAAAERCAKIVQTFLAMARQKPPVRRRVEAADVIGSALELTGYALRTADIEVVQEIDPDLPPLNADADQLNQVLVNLIVNAQHALEERPSPRVLTLRAATDARRRLLRLSVADNGPGVPPEHRRRIFEPFFTSKPQGVGTGIGLTFSQAVVQAHGGVLQLSDPPAGGACFTVELPAMILAEAPRIEPDGEGDSAPHGRTALVIDDEVDLGEALAEMLVREHYHVDLAHSGREGRALLEARRYDVVLSDLRMPDIDGQALFDWIERERPALVSRVAFVTGDTLGPAVGRFLACAGRPVLEKPFDTASLRTLLAELGRATPATEGVAHA